MSISRGLRDFAGLIAFAAAALAPLSAGAQQNVVAALEGLSRILIVSAEEAFPPRDGSAAHQIAMIDPAGYVERDLVILYAHTDGVWLVSFDDGSMASVLTADDPADMLTSYDVAVGEFQAILVGKDGTEKLRSDAPLSADELFAVIDAMPMRQAEMTVAPIEEYEAEGGETEPGMPIQLFQMPIADNGAGAESE